MAARRNKQFNAIGLSAHLTRYKTIQALLTHTHTPNERRTRRLYIKYPLKMRTHTQTLQPNNIILNGQSPPNQFMCGMEIHAVYLINEYSTKRISNKIVNAF